jgi:PKD repeat protein
MQIRFILPLLMSFYSAGAQIIITRSDMPASNDTIRFSTALPVIDVDTTGAGISWDFSGLQPGGQDLVRYKSSSQTPYFLHFLGMFGLKIADSLGTGPLAFKNVYSFFKSTTSKYTAEGIGFQYSGLPLPLAGYYSDPDEIYQFPLNYNDRDSSTFRVETSLPTIGSYIQSGYRINEVDGWGTITTPYGTFNCIRVKSTIEEIDSIVSTIVTLGFPVSRVEYKWLAKGEKIPVLQVDGQDLFGQFVPNSVKYRDKYRREVFADQARFSAGKTKVATIDTVSFSDQSFLAAGWQWSFSPPTVTYLKGTTAASKEPQVKFNNPGFYTVSLLATFNAGSDDTVRTNYIEAGIAPAAAFIAEKTTPKPGEAVNFTDNSTGNPLSWKWTVSPASFGFDGGTDETSKNPKIMFNSPGFYTVSLQAGNDYGSTTESKVKYIQVFGTGIQEAVKGIMSVYPNPASGILNISLPASMVVNEVSLYDVTGKKFLLSTGPEKAAELSLRLPQGLSGLYLLEVVGETGRSVTRIQILQ